MSRSGIAKTSSDSSDKFKASGRPARVGVGIDSVLSRLPGHVPRTYHDLGWLGRGRRSTQSIPSSTNAIALRIALAKKMKRFATRLQTTVSDQTLQVCAFQNPKNNVQVFLMVNSLRSERSNWRFAYRQGSCVAPSAYDVFLH